MLPTNLSDRDILLFQITDLVISSGWSVVYAGEQGKQGEFVIIVRQNDREIEED